MKNLKKLFLAAFVCSFFFSHNLVCMDPGYEADYSDDEDVEEVDRVSFRRPSFVQKLFSRFLALAAVGILADALFVSPAGASAAGQGSEVAKESPYFDMCRPIDCRRVDIKYLFEDVAEEYDTAYLSQCNAYDTCRSQEVCLEEVLGDENLDLERHCGQMHIKIVFRDEEDVGAVIDRCLERRDGLVREIKKLLELREHAEDALACPFGTGGVEEILRYWEMHHNEVYNEIISYSLLRAISTARQMSREPSCVIDYRKECNDRFNILISEEFFKDFRVDYWSEQFSVIAREMGEKYKRLYPGKFTDSKINEFIREMKDMNENIIAKVVRLPHGYEYLCISMRQQ